jgi:hypothetical protein
VRDDQQSKKENFMKKAKNSEIDDWGRPEYKRSDLGEPVRGKYAKRLRESTNVVVLDPRVAKVFPNDKAVNTALRALIESPRTKIRPGTKRKNKATEGKPAA